MSGRSYPDVYVHYTIGSTQWRQLYVYRLCRRHSSSRCLFQICRATLDAESRIQLRSSDSSEVQRLQWPLSRAWRKLTRTVRDLLNPSTLQSASIALHADRAQRRARSHLMTLSLQINPLARCSTQCWMQRCYAVPEQWFQGPCVARALFKEYQVHLDEFQGSGRRESTAWRQQVCPGVTIATDNEFGEAHLCYEFLYLQNHCGGSIVSVCGQSCSDTLPSRVRTTTASDQARQVVAGKGLA